MNFQNSVKNPLKNGKKQVKKGKKMPSFSSYRKCNYLKISGLRFFYPISTPSL